MKVAERRAELVKTICRRGHETIPNLAREFNTSKRTILRDIEVLSLTEPIYTKTGRYLGGVYIMDGYSPYNLYLKDEEVDLLQNILNQVEESNFCHLTGKETLLLKKMINSYSKPH